MPDNLVKLVSAPHTGEILLGALIVMVSYLFKRAVRTQDQKIEDNRREIKAINKRNRQTDQHIAAIHSDLSYIRGVLTQKTNDDNSQ
jgi:hypothetical protein